MIAKRERNEARGFAEEYEQLAEVEEWIEMLFQAEELGAELDRLREAYAELLRGATIG